MKRTLYLLPLFASCAVGVAPSAADDTATAIAGDSVLIDVLANDSDDQDDVSVLDTSAPANGIVVIEGDSLRYTPDRGFSGVDSFIYRAKDTDGRASIEARVTITVNPQLRLTILHNNNSDGESQVNNAGVGAEDFGGIARFATRVAELKQEALAGDDGINRGVLFFSTGDNFLAGPEFSATFELAPGQRLFDSIAIDLLGYDAIVFGNHDFDFGPDVLVRFLNDMQSNTPAVSANLNFTQEPQLQAFADAGQIQPHLIFDVAGQQIGVIGAVSEELPFVSSPRGVTIEGNIEEELQQEIDALTAQGVDKIIVLSHLRGFENDIALVPQLQDLDVWVGGGDAHLLANPGSLLLPNDTPAALSYPILGSDLDGRQIPMVTTGADYQYIGRLVVDFDARGEVIAIRPESGPIRIAGGANIDAVQPDPTVAAQVEGPVQQELNDLEISVVGVSSVTLDGLDDNVRSRETNLGNLLADSLLEQAKSLAADFGSATPNVGIQNGGGIRGDTQLTGNITAADTFTLLPFFNFLTVVQDVPASQFKEILENAYSKIDELDGRFAQISGVSVTISLSGTKQILDEDGNVLLAGSMVREASLDDGTPLIINGQVVANAPLLHIATNNFLARGGDEYPFRGARFITLGVTDQQTLASFIKLRLGGNINNNNYPEAGEARITILP